MSDPNSISIQWYPGHMTKARRMMEDQLKNVDALCEILDARIPYSSSNPDINALSAGKPRLVILNRMDLADEAVTADWVKHFRQCGFAVLVCDSKNGRGTNQFVPAVRSLLADYLRQLESKGQQGKALRVMIAGIPNVGKSSFINRVAGRKAAVAGDKPGVTRGKQWIVLDKGVELMDTPGILWPKFESEEVGISLALTNAINPDVFDRELLACRFFEMLLRSYPAVLAERYKLEPEPDTPGYELLEAAALKRGFLISRGEPDTERMAATLLKEFHDGKLGRLSLERPPEGIS